MKLQKARSRAAAAELRRGRVDARLRGADGRIDDVHVPRSLLCRYSMVVLSFGMAHGAIAQSSASGAGDPVEPSAKLDEIVVTAQHRSERLQDVPVAVASLSSSVLAQQGITSSLELSQSAPSLIMNSNVSVANPYIRGVGSDFFDPTSESPVAIYVDDVYVAAPQANIFSLAGIKQIDVLSGPQGTLFGRNATGGVIQIQTLDPTQESHLDVSATYGDYDYVNASFHGSTGIVEGVATSLTAQYENQGRGFGHDLFTGAEINKDQINNTSFRNKWVIDLPTGTTLKLSGDYARSENTVSYHRDEGSFSTTLGAIPPLGYVGRYNTNTNYPDYIRVESGGVSLKIDQDFSAASLTSISAYRTSHDFYTLDEDQSTAGTFAQNAFDLAWTAKYQGLSQELRLKGRDNSVFNWMVGGFYYRAKGSYNNFLFDGFPFIDFDQQETRSIAGFAQATVKLLENTELTGGVRYTKDTVQFEFPSASVFPPERTFKEPTYRVALDHHFSPDVMGYVSFNTGFKSGGYALLSADAYDPEKLKAYEVGLKTEWLDHTVRLNMDEFVYRYTDQQVNVNHGTGNVIENAGDSHIQGFEATVDYLPTSRLKLSGALTAMSGHYTDYPGYVFYDAQGNSLGTVNAKGFRTARTPKFDGTISAQYTLPTTRGDFAANVGIQHNSGYSFVVDPRVGQPSYTILNAGLSWSPSNGPFTVRVWGKNLTDANYYLIGNPNLAPVGDALVSAPPRTYGVTASFKY